MRSYQVKETLEKYDVKSVTDIDLIRPLLNDSIVDILVRRYNVNKITDIAKLDFDSIIRDDSGIGRSTIQKLKVILEIYKRDINKEVMARIVRPSECYEYCKEMRNFEQEHFRLLCLDSKNKIIGMKDIFIGSVNSSMYHPREIFKEAIKLSSASIMIVHNHPSGDTTPSKEDINVTLRIKECGKLMGIELLDHIIIGDGYYSFKEKALI